MADRPVTLAAIIGAHGIGGEVRLKLFTEDLASLKGYGVFDTPSGPLTLKAIRHGSNGAVARFAEIADRNGAEAMRGVALTVARSALPPLDEGEFYHADLIGLPCVAEDAAIGICAAVENFGAGDIIEIEKADAKRFMVPIAAVTIEDARLIIDPAFVE